MAWTERNLQGLEEQGTWRGHQRTSRHTQCCPGGTNSCQTCTWSPRHTRCRTLHSSSCRNLGPETPQTATVMSEDAWQAMRSLEGQRQSTVLSHWGSLTESDSLAVKHEHVRANECTAVLRRT